MMEELPADRLVAMYLGTDWLADLYDDPLFLELGVQADHALAALHAAPRKIERRIDRQRAPVRDQRLAPALGGLEALRFVVQLGKLVALEPLLCTGEPVGSRSIIRAQPCGGLKRLRGVGPLGAIEMGESARDQLRKVRAC